MKKFTYMFLLALQFTGASLAYATEEASFQTSLNKLIQGNERFIKGAPLHPNQSSSTREELISGQEPFAVVVSCSDSRIPPEIIFDQGLGDLFVVRCAGNVVDAIGIDSVEFATNKLHAPLVIVLGHQDCGAVNAVLHGQAKEYDIENIAPFIESSVLLCKGKPGNELQNAVELNAQTVANTLAASPVLKKLIDSGALKIVPAYYSQASGKVDFKN